MNIQKVVTARAKMCETDLDRVTMIVTTVFYSQKFNFLIIILDAYLWHYFDYCAISMLDLCSEFM